MLVLLFVCALLGLGLGLGVGAEEDLSKLAADEKLLLACYRGDLEMAKAGLSGGASAEAVLTPNIGERVLKLGRAGVDFPVAPALHVSVNGGTKAHLQIAALLLGGGADAKRYSFNHDGTGFSFPPAFMYGLGMENAALAARQDGSAPELVRRLWKTKPADFSLSTLNPWLEAAHPGMNLLHVTAMIGGFNGTYLLLSEFGFSDLVEEEDYDGYTPLQRAAGLGQWRVMDLLLYNGAEPGRKHALEGRSAVHMSAMRGCDMCLASMLFDKPHDVVAGLLGQVDTHGMSPLDLALLKPARAGTAALIQRMLGRDVTPPRETFRGMAPQEPLSDAALMSAVAHCAAHSFASGWFFRAPERAYMLQLQYIYHYTSTRSVDRVEVADATKQHMMAHYWRSGRPALMVGNLTAAMTVWARTEWTGLVATLNPLLAYPGIGAPPDEASRYHMRAKAEPLQRRLAGWYKRQRLAKAANAAHDADLSLAVPTVTSASTKDNNIGDGNCDGDGDGDSDGDDGALAEFSAVLAPDAVVLDMLPSLNVLGLGSHPSRLVPTGVARDVHLQFSLGGGANSARLGAVRAIVSAVASEAARPTEASLHLTLVGAAEALLLPQSYAVNVTSTLDSVAASHSDTLSFSQWRDIAVPRMVSEGTVAHTFMFAGDLLFVPRGWVAIVVPLGDSVSVTEVIAKIVP
jgi:hypothetical protein